DVSPSERRGSSNDTINNESDLRCCIHGRPCRKSQISSETSNPSNQSIDGASAEDSSSSLGGYTPDSQPSKNPQSKIQFL
ncbi:hypothetical protein GCK32_020886, partial [Trichostrongylus colubriformis]